MEFHVSLDERGDRTIRIYRALLDAVLDGRLRPGERVPPTRELAARLAVARNTVAAAYERLVAEGFLVSRVGAGTFVCDQAFGPTPTTDPATTRAAPAGRGVRPRVLWRELAEPSRPPAPRPRYDFQVGVPDVELFPFETWRRLVTCELRRSTFDIPAYGDPAGHAGLRAAIARQAGLSRSVRAEADDIVVTQGAQQALDLVGRILIEPGACVAMEDPGYPEARLLFRSHGARVVGVPVDDHGLVVDRLPANARLVYVTPSHQFPLGLPMSLPRRAALLAWAERHDAVIIEDDYDSEFRFSDRPLEPLQAIDGAGRVVYIGTFSKTLLPMLRVGYLVAPSTLQPALRTAKRLTDWHGSLPIQAALARFIEEGLLARHIRKATRVYAERHELLQRGLREHLAPWLEPVGSAAGLHLAALRRDTRSGPESSAPDVSARARSLGLAVPTLAGYYAQPRPGQRDGLVLGFGGIATADIAPALRLLATAFASS